MRHARVWLSATVSIALALGVWTSARSHETGDGTDGPKVGDRAPAFALASAQCETVALEDYAGKPVAVVFYRGQWWPDCRKQLGELQKAYASIQELGAELITISVDRLEKVRATVDKQKLTFPVLSDAGVHTVIDYGVLNEGANIARVATFVIDGDGIVRYRYVGANKKDRPKPKTILEQLAAAKG